MKKIFLFFILASFLFTNAFASKVGSKDEVVAALKKGGSIAVSYTHLTLPTILLV